MLVGWLLPAWPGHVAFVEPARTLEIQHEDLRLQQAAGHRLALAGLLALEQGHQDAERAEQPARQVGDGNADPHRPAAGLAGDRHQAAHALGDLIEARTLAVGPVLAEARDAGVDQPRVDLAQRRIVDAEPLFHVRPEVLDHHVGLGGQPAQHGNAARRLQVERDAALVAVQVLEVRSVPRATQSVALFQVAWQLDLDDVGTPVGQLPRGGRSRADPRQIKYRVAGERR